MDERMVTNLLKVIKEGSALVNFPKEVFYNPVQEFNRDLTISVINVFNNYRKADKPKIRNSDHGSGLRIFEALSATGLRSIRFAKEIDGVDQIIANDIDPIAVKLIAENVLSNNVSGLVDTNCGDANFFLYKSQSEQKKKFHVIDLDPYGSASRFLDAAVQGLTNGGLLCVTCTDAAVLCGSAAGTAYGKYGSVTIGNQLSGTHEQGLRVLLHAIQSAAGRHGLFIQPLLSLSVDFYFRVFVRVFDSPVVVKAIASKLGMVFSCTGCHCHHFQPLQTVEEGTKGNQKISSANGPIVNSVCSDCNSRFVIGGPLWLAPIHDPEFCDDLLGYLRGEEGQAAPQAGLGTGKRIVGMVSLAREELPERPLYYELDKLASRVRSSTPPMIEFRSALLNAGWRVSSSHCAPNSIKTDAPSRVLWDLMRGYMRESQPGKIEKLLGDPRTDSWTRAIVGKENGNTVVDFQTHKDANPVSRSQKLLRFQPNPMPNWGPKPKASKFQNE